MYVHLDNDIFDVVKNGTKCVEGRVNDEKRRKLHVGDKLIFLRRTDENDKITTIIEDLKYYNNFEEMVNDYDIKDIYLEGYSKEDYLKLIDKFYTKEEISKYGVVAIRFKKIED